MGPVACAACGEQVIEARAAGRVIPLDYALAPKGAVAARIDPGTCEWTARYLRFGEEADPGTEVRFRQHEVTCNPKEPDAESTAITRADYMTDELLTGEPVEHHSTDGERTADHGLPRVTQERSSSRRGIREAPRARRGRRRV
ncbi:MAG TPA: hypothetical protein VFQ44_02405 [Streptosporangiaceae bacterium]|nr:hypothetical protein [Streptosporangiaceae bacterium]